MNPEAPAATRLRLLLIGGSLVLALTQLRLHYRTTVVVGTSMQPTLATGDLLLVDQLAYAAAAPKRGDVLVCRYRGDLLVKRVVGLPGEELAMIRGTLLVNGHPLREPYVVDQGNLNISPGRVPAGSVVVMGDNRAITPYSFIFAIVPVEDIVGKVVYSLHLHLPPDTVSPAMTDASHSVRPNFNQQNIVVPVKSVISMTS